MEEKTTPEGWSLYETCARDKISKKKIRTASEGERESEWVRCQQKLLLSVWPHASKFIALNLNVKDTDKNTQVTPYQISVLRERDNEIETETAIEIYFVNWIDLRNLV